MDKASKKTEVTTVNTLSARPLVRTLGALLLGIAVAGAPALSYAQHGGSGGGHGGGGGGHFSGGGGGGGGHFSGGGGHYSGGGYHGGYYGGGHVAGGHYGGYYGGHGTALAGSYGGAHYYAGARGYGGAHYGAGYATGRFGAGYGAARFAGGRVFYPGRGYYPGRGWAGGYWNGVFWPRCYFNPGFAWFLPFLPFGYATFWWGGMPYYYANDLYYTYSPDDNGYVVTEPPPAAGGDVAGSAGAPASPAGDVYVYPRNGQSDQQMANDRYECHSWAVGQTGFDPTRGGQQSGNPDDYRRAMVSCLDARGYSAR
jgi:hypothetical protein